ncbi:maleylpyruvate isomerase family mycothiol-dependent enzyme [Mycobacterium sp.]|uniref:maleylpyruvate isomerase family mycothiol-dependent enzyme n=1 Tax=Mycobacterium sp. TaxID=1785 RepID=UPI0031DF322B
MSTARPVTELDRSDVLSGLFASWDTLDRLLAGLTDEQWRAPVPLPGWDVHAVVSHLVGSESALLGLAVPDVDVSALPHVRNDVGAANERWVRHLGGESGADLHQRFRAVTRDRRTQLTAMSDDDWNALTPTPVGPDSYGRFMRVRVFDCWMHEHDIRDALGRPAGDEELVGPDSRLALDEMAAGMGYVVGKLGGAPDGSRVAVELTGPLARTIRVAVDGRARVVDDFGGPEPTVTIRLDGLLFTRLAGGRVAGAPVELIGDEEVGSRIVEHLNYVI